MRPSIAVITINYNDVSGLERTLNSVRTQDLAPTEYVVIDGGSKDGSVDLISSNEPLFSAWVSEPDKGVYHAMNKGLTKVSSKYVLFLNSGDTFASEQTLKLVSEQLMTGMDLYYGDAILVRDNSKLERRSYPEQLRFSYLAHTTVVHQAQIIKRELFQRLSTYNEDLKLASDWEFLIRAVCLHNASYKYLGIPVVAYDMSGMSSNQSNEELLNDERKQVLRTYFPAFVYDYNELEGHRKRAKNGRFQKFRELERLPVGRKLNSIGMSVILSIYGLLGKRKKDGK